jgi:hypothetical protein
MADNDPFPTEEGKGGSAFQHEVAAWEARHQTATSDPVPPPPGGGGGGPAPRDPFSPYEQGSSNTARDQALAITEQFMQIMGWPSGIDERDLEMKLLQQGLELSPERAYNWLYTQIPEALQKANPNAEFGMQQDAYLTTINAFKDAFETLTGASDIPPDVLRMAVDQQWTQSELTRFLQNDKRYSDPALLPWLQQGSTFKDVKNQFFQTYGKNPTDPTQLAGWFSFRTQAQQVGSGTSAKITSSQGPTKGLPSQSEVR